MGQIVKRLVALATILGMTAAHLAGQSLPAEEIEAVQEQQFEQIERYLDRRIETAQQRRESAWKRDFSSLEAYERSVAPWRERLWKMLGGRPYAPAPLAPREQRVAEFPTHTAWRVWFTAFEDVEVYGVLLAPKGEGPFPALICVHGMAGTPEAVCGLAPRDYHNHFGRQAVERGYVVFAPLDINSQKKRSWLDRKAILIGQRLQGLEQYKMTRVVDYLSARADVDAKRIGAYGISWGGRTVMNLAALDERVAACVISGHFNDLVPKMITPNPHSSAFIETPEDYAFFWRHFELFTDADVVSLICPRPVFIEQGRQDRVAYWRRSQAAFEQVRDIYNRLGIPERAEYSIFEGPHEIHGVEAFAFLDRWLQKK